MTTKLQLFVWLLLTSISLSAQTIEYSTLFGGNEYDHFRASDISSDGAIYIGGKTNSTDFPVTDDTYGTTGEMFLCRINPELSQVTHSIRIAGTFDEAAEIWMMKFYNDELFVIGTMPYDDPENFPITHTIDPSASIYGSIFIAKFSVELELISSTYLASGVLRDMAFDNNGNVYIVGGTYSSIPQSEGSYQPDNAGGTDGYIIKISNDLTEIPASTFIGGEQWDLLSDIYIDDSNNVIVAGQTESDNLPATANAYQQNMQSTNEYVSDVFLGKFDQNLSSLLALSYFGGSNEDFACAIAPDNGNLIIYGTTVSDNLIPNSNLDESYNGDSDYYLAKLDNNFETFVSGTYLGGTGFDGTDLDYYYDPGIIIGEDDAITITGTTESPSILGHETNDPTQTFSSVFTIKTDNNLANILSFSTIDFESFEYACEITPYQENSYLLIGSTLSSDFYTTQNCIDATLDGTQDLFIMKFNESGTGTNRSIINPDNIKISPNPAKDFIYINSTSDDNIKITITDMQGRVILEEHGRFNTKTDITSVDPGCYIVTVTSNKKIQAEKLIIK